MGLKDDEIELEIWEYFGKLLWSTAKKEPTESAKLLQISQIAISPFDFVFPVYF